MMKKMMMAKRTMTMMKKNKMTMMMLMENMS